MRLLTLVPLLLLLGRTALAGDPKPPPRQEPPGIQDNSFLLEEAYNQEEGVVQHISGFARSLKGDAWVYTFTQEWPVRGQAHQLSFTVPLQRLDSSPTATGPGDVALNYRYQLAGSGDAALALAPRLSLLVPTGDRTRGLGAGGLGLQVNLAASWVPNKTLVTHANAGATLTPSATDALRERARTVGYNLGGSVIWLASPRLNVMLEVLWTRTEGVAGPDLTERSDSFFLSPGLRWAHNFASGLQIVPGIAVPLGVGPSSGDRSIFLYLSFEHPFKKAK